MPTRRTRSHLPGRRQKYIMTPADNAVAMTQVLDAIYTSGLSSRWNVIYESTTDTVTITQGSPEIVGVNTNFDDYLGDVWIAFGAAGFTPSKFYKIEAVHADTSIRLKHFITSSTTAGVSYVLARPIRYTIEFEPGNYDFENYPSHSCNTSVCLSMVGVSTDAQLFFDSAESLQGIVRVQGPSGELNIKRLGVYCTTPAGGPFVAQQPFRLQATDAGITDITIERCYVHSPHTDFLAGKGSGTIVLRNNTGVVGYDGLCGVASVDKFFMHGNILVSPITHSNGHGKSMAAVLVNNKASTFAAREIWVHSNVCEIIDDGSVSTATLGVSIKKSTTTLPTVKPKIVSSHNNIKINSGQTGVETNVANFAAGIYSWWENAGASANSTIDIESHGDVIELSGAGTNLHGYKAEFCKVSIWNRPDSHGIKKTNGGTVDDDGVAK